MNTFKTLLLLAAVLVFASSCQKKIHKIDDSFVGEWTTTGPDAGDMSMLTIDEDGDAVYEEYNDGVRVAFAEGPARLSEDNILKIGTRSGFRVTQFPSEEPTDDLNFNPTEEYELTMKLEKRFFFKH